MTARLVIDFASRTDRGLVRVHNEDAVSVDADHCIAVLADGMGGYNAGEVASRMATTIVCNELVQRLQEAGEDKQLKPRRLQQFLQDAVSTANLRVLEASLSESQYGGMGTTVVAAAFRQDRLVVAHLGDSRCYRLRHNTLTQLTHDHSQVQEQVDAGLISREWARHAPNKNLITRALGVGHYIDIEVTDHAIEEGDLYLLCSDGLSDMLDDHELTTMLASDDGDLELLAAACVQAANQQGGRDNISVVLARVRSVPVATNGALERIKGWFGNE